RRPHQDGRGEGAALGPRGVPAGAHLPLQRRRARVLRAAAVVVPRLRDLDAGRRVLARGAGRGSQDPGGGRMSAVLDARVMAGVALAAIFAALFLVTLGLASSAPPSPRLGLRGMRRQKMLA